MTPKLRNQTRRLHRGKREQKREKLWQAMRILRTFTTFELQAVTELANRTSAITFCSQLRRAGFVAKQQGNCGRHEPMRYKLLRDSGPQAPWLIHRGTAMYDPNTDTEYALS